MLQIASFSSFDNKVFSFSSFLFKTRVESLYISAAATMYQCLIMMLCLYLYILVVYLLPLVHMVGITNW